MKTAEEYYRDIQPLIENGWYQAAISAFEQLLQTHPTFALGHYEIGTLYYKTGAKEKALDCYKRAVECDPDNIDCLKSLADYYHAELEQIEPALRVYKTIIEKGTDDAETLFIAANLCVALHNFEDAVNYYQKVLEIEPWHSEAFEFLEKIKTHQANETPVASPEELYQQSQEAGASGDYESAVSLLGLIVDRYPDYAMAHNDLGVLYQKIGDNDQAAMHYQSAVRLEPHNSTFKKNLADFSYIVQGDVTAALKTYLEVLKSDPEDVEVLLAAGHISQTVNRPQNAEIFYSRILEIEPWNLEASERLSSLKKDLKQANSAGL